MIRLTGIPRIEATVPIGTRWVPITSLQSKYIGPIWYFGSYRFFQAQLTLRGLEPETVWLYRRQSRYEWYLCLPESVGTLGIHRGSSYASSWAIPAFNHLYENNRNYWPHRWPVDNDDDRLHFDIWRDISRGRIVALHSGTGRQLPSSIPGLLKLEVLLSEEQYQERRASNS